VFMRDRDPRQPGWPIFADAPPAAKDTRVRENNAKLFHRGPDPGQAAQQQWADAQASR
jgi:hypothetical protein